jgi:hypothetical protein
MPAKQFGEGVGVVVLREGVEQILIAGLTASLFGQQAMKRSEQRRRCADGHGRILGEQAKESLLA